MRAGLGLREVARLAGVSASYLSRVERGEQRATWQLVERVAAALSCPADELALTVGVVPADVLDAASRAWLEAVRG